MQQRLLVCGFILIGLAACRDRDAAGTSEQAAPAPQHAATIRGASAKGLLKADPMTLASCQPAVVTVAWDISSLTPGLNNVEIYAGEALFASGGSTGSSATGPWALPGSRFTLKGVPGGKELDTLVIGGPVCPP